MNLAAVALPLLLAAAPATLYERHWHGDGVCSGQDQVPLFNQNWERAPLSIVRAEIVFQPDGTVGANSYVYAGDSTPGSDIMAYGLAEHGTGFIAASPMPPGTAMPLGVANHVDLHVGCYPAGVHYQVLEIVWYLKGRPEWNSPGSLSESYSGLPSASP